METVNSNRSILPFINSMETFLDFPFAIFEFRLCHLWMLWLLYLDVVVVIFGCNLFHLWMLSLLHHFLRFSFIGFSHWMLSLDAIFGCYLEECHPLIIFPPGQFLMCRVRRGSAWTKEELEAIIKGNAWIDFRQVWLFSVVMSHFTYSSGFSLPWVGARWLRAISSLNLRNRGIACASQSNQDPIWPRIFY